MLVYVNITDRRAGGQTYQNYSSEPHKINEVKQIDESLLHFTCLQLVNELRSSSCCSRKLLTRRQLTRPLMKVLMARVKLKPIELHRRMQKPMEKTTKLGMSGALVKWRKHVMLTRVISVDMDVSIEADTDCSRFRHAW